MAQHDGSLILKTFVDQSGINKGIQSIKGSLSSLAGALGVAFSTVALVNFGKEAVQLASDIQEVQNVVDVTFGKSAKTINSFSKTAIKQFGLSELAAKRYASTMGAMLKSSGLADEAVLNMSQSLTGLAGDLASFYNLSSDEAFNKLRAGISGESEPLKQLGINLSVANLEAVALSKGITKSYESMSEAEKVMVRYYAILDKTNDAQGDYARTADSFANKMRNLSMKWEGFQQVMGQTIMIFAEAILPALETAIDKLTEIAYYLYAFTRAMSGVTEREGTIFSQQIQDTSNAADSAAQVLPEAAEGIEQTGEAAKKATKQLAAFDDLMILTASGNSDIFDGDFGNIDSINNQIAGIDSLLDSETMKSIEEFERWVSDNKDGIQEALDTGAMIALGAAIGGVAGKIVNSLLPSFGKKDTGLDKQTKKTWKEWAAQSALSGVFALTGAAAGLLTGKLIGNTDAEKENSISAETNKVKTGELAYAAETLGEKVGSTTESLKQESTEISNLSGATENAEVKTTLFGQAQEKAKEKLSSFIAYVEEKTPSFQEIVTTAFDGARQSVDKLAQSIWDAYNAYTEWLNITGQEQEQESKTAYTGETIKKTTDLFPHLSPSKMQIGNIFSAEREKSEEEVKELTVKFSKMEVQDTTLKPLTSEQIMAQVREQGRTDLTYTNDWTAAGGKIAKDIDDFMESESGEAVKYIAEETIKLLAKVIPFIFSAGLSVVGIPLAKGGIVPHATRALVGEAGKEAVLPLENNTEWMDILADKIAMRGGFGTTTGANVIKEEHYNLGTTELMSIIYKLAKGGERLQGESLISGGVK